MTLFGKAARALAWLLVQAPAPLLPTTSSVVHSQTVEVGGVYKSDEVESVRMTYPSSSFDIYGAHRLQ